MTFLQRSCAGAVLVLVIVLLRGLLGRRLPRRTFTALWWVAALRLLLPLPLPSPLSVYTLFAALRRPAAETAVPAIPVYLLPAAEAAPAEAPAAAAVSGWAVLYWVAAAGLALWFLSSYIRWRHRFAVSLPAPAGIAPGWEHPRVALRVSDRIAAPLSYGLLRPVILLPRSMDWTDGTALRCVLAHEYAHIRHLDGLAKLLFAAALCRFWFHPAAWVLYVLGSHDLELACDEEAVRRLGHPGEYARALLRMEERRSRPLYNHFSQYAVEERIKIIMTNTQKKWSLAALLLAVLLAAGVTTAFATSADDPPADRTLPAETAVPPEEAAEMCLPVPGGRQTAGFGSRTIYSYPDGDEEAEPVEETLLHSGIDLAAERGTAILAALDGTVEATGFDASWGNYVLLDHGGGLKTFYAHCASTAVAVGDTVARGETIAAVGSSGMSTGPHLHFEVQQDGQATEPIFG